MATAVQTERSAGTSERRTRLPVRQPPYQRHDVLTMEELALGLRCSVSQVYRVVAKLKVSYLLGSQSPRVLWGDVCDLIHRTAES